MRSLRPVLRSPPFAGVPARAGAISMGVPHADTTRAGTASLARLRLLRESIVTHRVGGTFWAREPAVPPGLRVLLVPGRGDDVAAHADRVLGTTPVEALLAVLPAAGWASAARRTLERRGIAVEQGEIDPWPLLTRADALYGQGDTELRFLAGLAGVAIDSAAPADPGRLPDDAAARLIDGVGYRDCYTGRAIEAEAAVAQLAFWRGVIDANRGVAAGAGIAIWKRREIAAMLWNGPRRLRTFASARGAVAAARGRGAVAVWPSRAPAGIEATAAAADVPLWQVEDGFVRSVGLGSGLHPPLSIVLDRQGIHFDPAAPSDLETILATRDFEPALIARAERLADRIVRAGISKYAVGRGGAAPLPTDGRRRVLVPGQVEDDLSVLRGGGAVRGNLDLLRRVRLAEPDAVILFKPHPDVLAGHRTGDVPDGDALRYADAIVRDTPMAALLDGVDAVHVLTSLAGFEALLRGREVVTHGGPFYAGWGLTRDLAGPFPRRTRTLTLGALVAGAMIVYPRYLDPVTRLPCPPEILIDRLTARRQPAETWLTRLRALQGRLRGPRGLARAAA